MDSIIVRGHQSLAKLAEFAPVSGTFHKVNGREGLIFAHGGKFYGIPEIDLEQEMHESSDEPQENPDDVEGEGVEDSASEGKDESDEGEGESASTSTTISASTQLPLARKK